MNLVRATNLKILGKIRLQIHTAGKKFSINYWTYMRFITLDRVAYRQGSHSY
jgi:hypothetical protein